jgi:hypothetical protein
MRDKCEGLPSSRAYSSRCRFSPDVYVPGRLLVASDSIATVRNVAAALEFFRLGFLIYVVEAVRDITLIVLFHTRLL